VRAVDDRRDPADGGILDLELLHEDLERALAVAVRELRARSVERMRLVFLRIGEHVVGWDVDDLSPWVDEPQDQPGACGRSWDGIGSPSASARHPTLVLVTEGVRIGASCV